MSKNENQYLREANYWLFNEEETESSVVVIAVKKPIPLGVQFATEDGITKTLEGNVPHEVGHAIMTGTKGENWPIQRDKFENTYEPVGGTKMGEDGEYAKKAIPVKAYKMNKPFEVNVSWADTPIQGKAGDWKLEYGPDDFGAVDAEIFDQTYDIKQNIGEK
jgi:hypothetical protein